MLIEAEVTNYDILSGRLNVSSRAERKVRDGDSEDNCAVKYCVGCVESFDVAGLGRVDCLFCSAKL